MRKIIVLLTGIGILALVNFSIYRNERVLADGRLVFLELAPVDPRSLMQGDYMALRFAIARSVSDPQRDGYLVVGLDNRGVGIFRRLDDGNPLAPDELKLFYRVRDNGVKLGTNAFFFQEGDASLYAAAKYGEARVDSQGQMLLTGLRDVNLQPMGLTSKTR